MRAPVAPDFVALAQSGLRRLKPYDPGHDLVALRRRYPALIELGSNENVHGCSARVRPALEAVLDALHLYPDPLGGELKAALASLHAVRAEQIVLGNGSHELLMQFAQAFSGAGDEVVASEFGFAVYALAAQAAGATLVTAKALPVAGPMPRGHDLDAIAAAIGARTRLVYLANPNNPTGTWFVRHALAEFLERVPHHVLVVVDEAYQEYVVDPDIGSAIALLGRFPNLVVTRTFSKAHGLAGLRVGYAVAHPGLVAVMERLRESFNVNALGLAAATAALGDPAHVERVRRDNAVERDWLADELRARGWPVSPSETNFLLVEFGAGCEAIEQRWLGAGIVVRPMAGYGLGDCLRITVGRRADNVRLLAVLDRT